jgi:hypothetical protein
VVRLGISANERHPVQSSEHRDSQTPGSMVSLTKQLCGRYCA